VKLQIVSDLHVDVDAKVSPFVLPNPGRDVLIIAGDLAEGIKGADFIRDQLHISPVIYAFGNHEFYGQSYTKLIKKWEELAAELLVSHPHRLFIMHDKVVMVYGQTFIGSTLWTDFDKGNPLVMTEAGYYMNDYQRIRDDQYRKIRPMDTLRWHAKHMQFLEQQLSNFPDSVVVTHHGPTYQSIAPRFKGDKMNPAYVSDLSKFILRHQPKLWCHGHVHAVIDYTVDKTRVVANARGYENYGEHTGFDPSFMVEI